MPAMQSASNNERTMFGRCRRIERFPRRMFELLSCLPKPRTSRIIATESAVNSIFTLFDAIASAFLIARRSYSKMNACARAINNSSDYAGVRTIDRHNSWPMAGAKRYFVAASIKIKQTNKHRQLCPADNPNTNNEKKEREKTAVTKFIFHFFIWIYNWPRQVRLNSP